MKVIFLLLTSVLLFSSAQAETVIDLKDICKEQAIAVGTKELTNVPADVSVSHVEKPSNIIVFEVIVNSEGGWDCDENCYTYYFSKYTVKNQQCVISDLQLDEK